MKKVFDLIYAVLGYILAMLTLAYIMAFVIDFAVPISINSGSTQLDIWAAALINCALVLLFGLHHSITARPWFKKWWTQYIPKHLERSTYLYMTTLVTALLIIFWQPIPITLWKAEQTWAVAALISSYLLVWMIMFMATFHFGHFSFFGLGEVWAKIRRNNVTRSSFSAKYLYALVRHPISLGWMLTPWLVPHFTLGQLIFSVSVAIYVLTATVFEERDLIQEFGETYKKYKKHVPAFIPFT